MQNQIKPQLPRPFVATAPGVRVVVTPVRYVTAERVQAFVTVNGERVPGVIYQPWREIVRTYAAIVATWGGV